MSAGRIIAYIVAAILILFGVLFILGSGGTGGGGWGWVFIGVILVLIAFGLIILGNRMKPAAEAGPQNVTLKIDLPANVEMDTLKCKSCGGVITTDNIEMVAGAPVVTCPYCHTVYQLTEDPKW
jgi:Na+/melibiose symporter-like transporter